MPTWASVTKMHGQEAAKRAKLTEMFPFLKKIKINGVAPEISVDTFIQSKEPWQPLNGFLKILIKTFKVFRGDMLKTVVIPWPFLQHESHLLLCDIPWKCGGCIDMTFDAGILGSCSEESWWLLIWFDRHGTSLSGFSERLSFPHVPPLHLCKCLDKYWMGCHEIWQYSYRPQDPFKWFWWPL